MLLVVLIVLMFVVLALLGVVVLGIHRVKDDMFDLSSKVDQLVSLSLNPRTRIGQATMQSGPKTDEQVLEKLGRVSASRRVVVGGEDDSTLKRQMQNGVVDHE